MASSLPSEPISNVAPSAITETQKPRLFISYKRKGVDEQVALEVFKALATDNKVFIDQIMSVGTHWAERIESELRNSDFLVVFLSAQSVTSQMVKSEIATAYRLAQEANGRPAILPVRLDYKEPFQYPLSAYLDHINWSFWSSLADTPRIIEELRTAIAGGELSIKSQSNKNHLLEHSNTTQPAVSEPLPDAQPTIGKQKPLHAPDRPVDFKSDMYVVRDSDKRAENMIQTEQVTITIKGPDQRGKSSLLFRMLDTAKRAGKEVVFIDFQLTHRKTLSDEDRFFRVFCSRISDELDLEDKTEEYWSKPRDNSERCTLYMRKHILHRIGEETTLVLAIDETESVADADFSDNFYTMLRNWHERRGWIPELQRLDMVFVVSTEPYRLIKDDKISPFNVGDPIELEDFSEAQVAALNQLHPYPLSDEQVKELFRLLGGHPYLTRRALYIISNRTYTVSDLFAKAADAYGPFGDHLRHHLFELRKQEAMVKELKHVLDHKKSADKMVSHMLRGAGLITGSYSEVTLRCPLYERFFRRHLDVEH
jgi:AAA-like domain/TIR domain